MWKITSEKELRAKSRSISAKGISVEQSQRAYTVWAEHYEQDLLQHGYSSHIAVSQKLCEYIPTENRGSLKILDAGAGTGLVAKTLLEEGFTNIDALDASQAMLDEAKKDNRYNRYIVDYITASPLDIPASSYDAITGSGIFSEGGHVPCNALAEFIRLVRKGGFIVLSARCSLLEAGGVHETLEPLMKKLVDDNKWELQSREIWERYILNMDAVVWCFRVL